MSDYGSDAEDETEFTCANVRPPPPAIAAFSISSLSELVEAWGAHIQSSSYPPVRGARRPDPRPDRRSYISPCLTNRVSIPTRSQPAVVDKYKVAAEIANSACPASPITHRVF